MPSVLLVVAALLPWASAQSVCQTGWTQAPSSSDWGSKCYRELGPPERDPEAIIIAGGYNYSACSVACKAESGTARMLCLASDAEAHFVTYEEPGPSGGEPTKYFTPTPIGARASLSTTTSKRSLWAASCAALSSLSSPSDSSWEAH